MDTLMDQRRSETIVEFDKLVTRFLVIQRRVDELLRYDRRVRQLSLRTFYSSRAFGIHSRLRCVAEMIYRVSPNWCICVPSMNIKQLNLLHGRFYRTSEALDAHILEVLNMETSVAKERAALLSLHDKLNRQGIVFNAISRNLDTAVSERYSLDGRFELKSLMRNRRLCRHSSRFWQRKPSVQ
ncbi:hypothetical protein T03_5148 [Trichinella britovi]|uniref:Uncharacterized protein n=1 Tax=Trichinella britovi TaxID=45882 RepID=A0A0V1C9C3_TRIBR|nr:hypothetical protein T03_5148 [Trichinella britovi]